MKFNKTNREDYPEYELITDQYEVPYGQPIEEVVGYLTKFGEKKWTFRVKYPFKTSITMLEEFKSRKAAVEAGLNGLIKEIPEPTPEPKKQKHLRPKVAEALFPRKGRNNRKTTKWRKKQYVPTVVRDVFGNPILDENGNFIKTVKRN